MTTKKHRYVWAFCILFAILAGYGAVKIGSAKAPVTDELYTYFQFKDQSIGELFDGLHSGVNRHPWVYFVYLWTWDQFMDMDMETCRLANLPFLVIAFTLIVFALAKRISPLAALTGTAAVFCLPWIVPNHLCQARPETMMLAASAIQLTLFLKLESTPNPTRRLLIGNGAISYLMPAIHYFGGIYSLTTFLILVLLDWKERKQRWKAYASFLAGWLLFFATCGSTLIDQFALGSRLEDWRVQPSLESLTDFLITILPALPVVILIALLVMFVKNKGGKRQVANKRILPLLALGLAWLLPPMFFWLLGRAGIYLYASKYFYPSLLGGAIILGCMVHFALGNLDERKKSSKPAAAQVLIGAFLAFCLAVQFYQTKKLIFSESGGNNFHRILEPGENWSNNHSLFVTPMDSVYLVNLYLAEKQQKECTFRLLFDHEKESRAYLRFSAKIQTFTPAELSKIDSFIFVTIDSDSVKTETWAAKLGFHIHRSASYNQHLFHAWQLKRALVAPNES